MAKYRVVIDFSIPGFEIEPGDRMEVREFIRDALECWGGQRHPDDWLFYGFHIYNIGAIKEKKS